LSVAANAKGVTVLKEYFSKNLFSKGWGKNFPADEIPAN
jgi:hypothetical protein